MRILQTLMLICIVSMLQFVDLAAQPDVNMKVLAFQDQDGPYLEIQMFFPGSSLAVTEVDSIRHYARVHNTVLVKRDDEIVNYEKYTLTGPKTEDRVDLQDIIRFRVPKGELTVQATTMDVFADSLKTIKTDTVNTVFTDSRVSCSNISLYASIRKARQGDPDKFIRGGYYVEPLTHDFYHRELDELVSYLEVYNSDETFSGPYALSYALLRNKSGDEQEEVKRKYKKMTPSDHEGMFLRMNMADIRSGFYTYQVDVIDRNKNVLESRSVRFYRSKPSLDRKQDSKVVSYDESFIKDISPKELDYSLKAIAPKIDQRDVQRFNNLVDKGSVDSKRSFLYNFWYRVDPHNTKSTYESYMEVARALDNMYDTGFGHGFESDRGYIYLKYGRPDDMIKVEDDPSAPPYEIWTYYQLPSTSQKNVKFVFYNPHLMTNGFELLHSTARGEINNPQWLLDLYEDAPEEVQGDNYLDATEMQDNWNRHALEYFNDN